MELELGRHMLNTLERVPTREGEFELKGKIIKTKIKWNKRERHFAWITTVSQRSLAHAFAHLVTACQLPTRASLIQPDYKRRWAGEGPALVQLQAGGMRTRTEECAPTTSGLRLLQPRDEMTMMMAMPRNDDGGDDDDDDHDPKASRAYRFK